MTKDILRVLSVLLALLGSTVAVAQSGIGERCGGDFDIKTCIEGTMCESRMPTCFGALGMGGGRCVEVKADCIGVVEFECGCDGKTYLNECERRRAGIQKASEGSCQQAAKSE